jgi:hypothetical protein
VLLLMGGGCCSTGNSMGRLKVLLRARSGLWPCKLPGSLLMFALPLPLPCA